MKEEIKIGVNLLKNRLNFDEGEFATLNAWLSI